MVFNFPNFQGYAGIRNFTTLPSAIEKKNSSLGKVGSNPILNARKLLESVTQKFKEKPEEESLKIMENFRSQIEQLSHNEKALNDQIECLPEKVTNFNSKIEDIDVLLKASEVALEQSPDVMEEGSLGKAETELEKNTQNRMDAVKLMEGIVENRLSK